MANAGPGAWVLYRPSSREIHNRVMDSRRRGVVLRVEVYAAQDGRYLRTQGD